MPKIARNMSIAGLGAAALLITSCASSSIADRKRPDELAVSRQAPLVIPPEFNLVPPRPGAPRPLVPDSESQAMQALFGKDAKLPPRSSLEDKVLNEAGAADKDSSIRNTSSNVSGSAKTETVEKGGFLKTLLDAPVGNSDPAVASVTTGGQGS